MSDPAAPPSLADRLALVLDGLCRVLAGRGSRDRAAAPLMLLLWARLRRTVLRFASLAARHRAGAHQPTPRKLRTSRPGRPAPPRLPRGFGWLVARVPEAAAYGEYLRQVLDDPEMAALLEAAPQAGRLLRPLCRMLAVRPGPVLLPKPPDCRPPAAVPAPPNMIQRPLPSERRAPFSNVERTLPLKRLVPA